MAKTGIQQKRRRYVHKQEQDTSNAYVGGNNGSNKGKKYNTGDYTTKKTKGYDSLTAEGKERRGRGGSGKTKYKSTTTGSKARNRSTNRRNKAKSGGK